MDDIDILVWCGLIFLALSAVLGVGRLYEWCVKPARFHTPPSASLTANPYSIQDR